MIKQGMNLTKEQRGEIKQEAKMDGASASIDNSDDKKSAVADDEKQNLRVRGVMNYFRFLIFWVFYMVFHLSAKRNLVLYLAG